MSISDITLSHRKVQSRYLKITTMTASTILIVLTNLSQIQSIPSQTYSLSQPSPSESASYPQPLASMLASNIIVNNNNDTINEFLTDDGDDREAAMNGTAAATTTTSTPMSARLDMAVLSMIFIMIIIGNVPIVMTIIFGKLVKTRMYYFLLHLCFADLITGIFNVIPQLAWEFTKYFIGGNVLCKSVKYLQILGPYLSSYTLVAMSIDRFLAICYPLSNNHLSLNRAKKSIALSWFLALMLCLPQTYIFSYTMTPYGMNCWAEFPFGEDGQRFYVTWYAVTVFIIPFSIIFYTNFNICWELWGSHNSSNSPGHGHHQDGGKKRNQSLSAEVGHRLTSTPLITTTSLDGDNVITTSTTSAKGTRRSITVPSTPSEVQPMIGVVMNETSTDGHLQDKDGNLNNKHQLKVNHDHQHFSLNDGDVETDATSNITFPLSPSLSTTDQTLKLKRSPLKVIIRNNIKRSTSFISSNFKSSAAIRTDGSNDCNDGNNGQDIDSKDRDRSKHSPTPASLSEIRISDVHGHKHVHHDEEHRRAKIKSVKLTVTVILCYVLCSVPFLGVQLWASWWPGATDTDAYKG